ncbi:MAG: Deoxyribodipyrimidine photo-lyase-related protein [Chloroflexi bacterium]|nr:Deoxyribodipyrimidine photo-lyase-related protein [Chloroflexota bacterium]
MRTTVWILGDQLLEQHPALMAAVAEEGRNHLHVVLVESRARAARLPYQRKKLVLLFSAMRHYAVMLKEQGYAVEILRAADMLSGLRKHIAAWRPDRIYCMAASEYAGRRFQERLDSRLGVPVVVLPNTQFLSGQFDPIPKPQAGKRYVMENFYRAMRRHFNLLMEQDGKPTGDLWNYDAENRRPLPKGTLPPERLRFEPDEITRQVMQEVAVIDNGVGTVDGFDLAVNHREATQAFLDFLDHRLESFGPYEDAMSSRSDILFHSLLSPYLNIGLLEPLPVAQLAEARFRDGQATLQSVEGFIRQVIGWREFIYWQYWRQMPGLKEVNFWNAHCSLPGFFWNAETDMNCLRIVLERALHYGYTHHIERLMVLSNFCLLAGISPQQVTDWFTACFVDAYEWVMLPNVLGMGLHADGGIIATKPYIASANYINKMSDYCAACRYDPKLRHGQNACPFNLLYWNFLIQHEQILRSGPRMGPNVLSLRRIGIKEQQAIQQQAGELSAIFSLVDLDPP